MPAILSLLLVAPAAQGQVQDVAARFDVRDVMIPARDGVRLHTMLFIPKTRSEPLPFILKRTPYGIEGSAGNLAVYMKDLADDGYIFVFQDIRGKFGSEGTFVMQRPACPEPAASQRIRIRGSNGRAPAPAQTKARADSLAPSCLDEGTDTYDTIEWLLRNAEGNNGRVGMLGISYDGWTTIMGALQPHPALKAISPQASPADMWLGDDFHHNGAFRLSYGFEYAAMMESGKETQQFAFDRYDTYDWYLSLGPLSNIDAKYLNGRIPTWNDYVAHPDYDAFWQLQTMIPHITSVRVPTLNVAGWWDQEDFYGPIRIYDALEAADSAGINYLVVGPWNHGGWSRGTGESLGPLHFGSNTSEYFRHEIQAPWFAYWLKDRGRLDLPEALTFEAGTNQWRRWDAWPPKQRVEARSLWFSDEGRLSLTPPATATDAFDSFISDPAHPVPYRQRPVQATYGPGSTWRTWLLEDQRFVDDRADVLSWESDVLEADITIAGDVIAHLFAATTGSDVDWVVKLIDVFPEQMPEDWSMAGYQLMVSNEVFRGRYRGSYERPAPVTPDSVAEYRIDLHTQNYTFRKGHRIMVQVQSTWFPLIDRNPQTFVPNIFEAGASDFITATHRVHRSTRFPSRVDVSVIEPRTS